MYRFKSGISFLIVLISVLAGLGAAILHPYVHVLKTEEHSSSHHAEDTHQEFAYIDSVDICYVCTFSKKLTFDEAKDVEFKLTFISDSSEPLPLFYSKDGYESVIFLRGPPLV